MKITLKQRRERRIRRVRSRVVGTPDRPRLAVFRSNKHLSAQLIDDTTGETLLALSDSQLSGRGTKTEKARLLGEALAKQAIKKGIRRAVFDRRHYRFHGRVAAFAQSARENGLEL